MKSVLVTGGTTRLGKVIAARLQSDGWRVFTSSHREDAGADFTADFTDPAAAVRLYAQVCSALGGFPPDAIVNNAALFLGEDSAIEAVNLTAPKKLTTLMACREEGMGSVVNILDCRVLDGAAAEAGEINAYTRSKRELYAFTRSAASMFAMTLRVNAVAPGPVLAPVGVHESAGQTPFGRPKPEEVADAVGFLLRAESTGGCVIPVDGGQSL